MRRMDLEEFDATMEPLRKAIYIFWCGRIGKSFRIWWRNIPEEYVEEGSGGEVKFIKDGNGGSYVWENKNKCIDKIKWRLQRQEEIWLGGREAILRACSADFLGIVGWF